MMRILLLRGNGVPQSTFPALENVMSSDQSAVISNAPSIGDPFKFIRANSFPIFAENGKKSISLLTSFTA